MVDQITSDEQSSSSHSDQCSVTPVTELGASETSLDEHQQLRIEQADQIYAYERNKRLRADAAGQFVDVENSENFKHFAADCWFDSNNSASKLEVEEGTHIKCLVIGAGFGGLLFAVRLIDVGFKPSDLVMVDTAAGFGGTWYWNRYPGLMCDVESYIYLPLLEETGYMPKHKYSYGDELRAHANRIAQKWKLDDRAAFRTTVRNLSWDDAKNVWHIAMTQQNSDNSEKSLRVTADFVIVASGFLDKPQLTDFEGVNQFRGHSFHTARWDYKLTGGSSNDPSLVNLKDQKVGIVGTGATAVQVVPHLAQWSKELYVFQRTPASVDVRGQKPTDRDWWSREIEGRKGWQRERSRNFIAFTVNTEPRPEVDLINDGWTHCPTFSAAVGTPRKVAAEDISEFIVEMQALDLPRAERIRARTEEIVKDKVTAENLKSWYWTWCKRPTFHDEYLSTFNRSNVTLVDTNGKGISGVTEKGIIANNQLYELDVIVYSTGFTFKTSSSPAARAAISAYGRKGRHLEEKWSQDFDTLHGVMTRGFPNLFFHALAQGAGNVNFTASLDCSARHVAFIIAEALNIVGPDNKVTIEPTATAERNWGDAISAASGFRAPSAGCTPSYYNGQGTTDELSAELKKKATRAVRYPYGLNQFDDFLDEWHAKKDLSELDIHSV